MKRGQKQAGFTIVELLIVIVVIAILAAITIVAYNGIQARAILTKQVAEIDRVGKAVQLWQAENGESIGQSGHGRNGNGYGGFSSEGGSYPPPSLENMLRNSGYLTGSLSVNKNYMLAACTDYTSTRWLVLATLDPAPSTSAPDQVAAAGCNHWTATMYTDPNGSYKRNYAKAF